ncbi:MAG: Asp-tRNA(Asn)/Glu-tRNA(Gln) amidotransferase subunit GatC [Syntrophomonadaceae bacterium]|nr:Asp-tRNA(Asn)/Glu-tRNA(Gln) amidotransferase subunit GatC [Syntrophomonadaceae bacterium]
MTLSRQEVEHVAMLARLKLSEEEKERLSSELGAILDYVERLEALPTAEVEPLAHVLPMHNAFRPDEPRAPFARDEMLANAPQALDGLFKVPRIL